MYSCVCIILDHLKAAYIFLNKGVLLYNHNRIIKFRKLTLIFYYHLTYRPHLNVLNFVIKILQKFWIQQDRMCYLYYSFQCFKWHRFSSKKQTENDSCVFLTWRPDDAPHSLIVAFLLAQKDVPHYLTILLTQVWNQPLLG